MNEYEEAFRDMVSKWIEYENRERLPERAEVDSSLDAVHAGYGVTDRQLLRIAQYYAARRAAGNQWPNRNRFRDTTIKMLVEHGENCGIPRARVRAIVAEVCGIQQPQLTKILSADLGVMMEGSFPPGEFWVPGPDE